MNGRTAPTRSNLVQLRRRLDQVEKGAALLRKKRESLVAELFARARPALDTRRAIEDQARAAYATLLDGMAAEGSAESAPLGWPPREVRVQIEPRDVWGIRGIAMGARPPLQRSAAARGVALGPGDAPVAAAAEAFEGLLERLLEAAPEEVFLRRLGDALRRTTRLVNTLEQRVTAALARDVTAMRRTLDERDREEHVRRLRMSAARQGGTT
jgi:V/A-type H+-transporting ATPase subunit D